MARAAASSGTQPRSRSAAGSSPATRRSAAQGGGFGEGGGVFISGTSANASLTDVLITLNSAIGGTGRGPGLRRRPLHRRRGHHHAQEHQGRRQLRLDRRQQHLRYSDDRMMIRLRVCGLSARAGMMPARAPYRGLMHILTLHPAHILAPGFSRSPRPDLASTAPLSVGTSRGRVREGAAPPLDGPLSRAGAPGDPSETTGQEQLFARHDAPSYRRAPER